jgi:hypothetical protein
MKVLESFNEFVEKNNSYIFITNKSLRGFANWQTPEEVLESFKKDIYFLGYEEYEGIIVEVKVISDNKFSINLDSDYSFNYISEKEKDLEKFFRNVISQILSDDYIKLYSVDGKKINMSDIQSIENSKLNENSDEENYQKYLDYKKSMTKNFTEEEFNNLSQEDLTRVIIASNDGQGDTSLDSFFEISTYYDEGLTNIEILDSIFEMGGNYVKIGWIENNKLFKLFVQ